MTMQLIETITVGSLGSVGFAFNAIPQNYTDLLIKVSARTGKASAISDNFQISLNSISYGFGQKEIYGTGSGSVTTDSLGQVAGMATGAGATAGAFSNFDIYIPKYASNQVKLYWVESATENNAQTATLAMMLGSWQNISAITSILFMTVGSQLQQHSIASLYGINKGAGGATVSF